MVSPTSRNSSPLPTSTRSGQLSSVVRSCTASYTIAQADLDAGAVSNTARARVVDAGVTSAEDSATVEATQDASLSLGLSVVGDQGVKHPGEVITYRSVLTNDGNTTLIDLSVIATLDGGAKLDSVECDVSIPAPSLAPDDSITCTATHRVTRADATVGSVAVVACVAGMSATGLPYVLEECHRVSTDVRGTAEQLPSTDTQSIDASSTARGVDRQPPVIVMVLLTSGLLLAGAWGIRIRRRRERTR